MTRLLDRPIPAFTPSDNELLDWPASVHLLLESQSTLERWDEPGVYWDDPGAKWDQAALPGVMNDVACDLAGVDIEHGPSDDSGLFPAGSMAATLLDRNGLYSRYRPDGSLQTWQLGKRASVIVTYQGQNWWLFNGRITAWTDHADGTIEIEAFNLPHELTPVGKFTAGTPGDKPAARINAIRTFAQVTDVISRLDAGTVTLTRQETQRSPWEEMQVASSLSDGGILFPDADDAIVYRDRTWRDGRTDQTRIWTLSDTDCSADIVVWDAALITSDDGFSTGVTLTNVAELRAHKELAVNPYAVAHVLTHGQPDQWTTQAEGDTLAQHLLDHRSVVLVDIDTLLLYVHDPEQDIWPFAVDARIGDLIAFRHDFATGETSKGQFTIGSILNLIRHSIHPNEWVMQLGAWTFLLQVATVAVAGTPGHYLDANGKPAQTPQSFGELSTLAADPVMWADGEYVTTGDGTDAYHDINGWHIGQAPPAQPGTWGHGRWGFTTWQ